MTRQQIGRACIMALAFALLTGSIVATSPRAEAAEADDCGGHNQPLCQTIKSCVSVGGGPFSCTTDYYYFPDAI
jgi:hypothetical protein